MRLSVIIPAYNEEVRLPRTLEHIHDYIAEKQQHGSSGVDIVEVIVVDDGSIDTTAAVAREWNGRLTVQVIRFPVNRGKGAAVREGMLAARGDCALLYDADAATPIQEVEKLWNAMEAKGADIAIGSRVFVRQSAVSMQIHRRIIGRIFHLLCAPLVPGIHDTACGCKLFRREAARKLFSIQRIDRFAYDVEVLSLALGLGYRIVEVPVNWTAIPGSKVAIVGDGFQMFTCLVGLHVRKWLRAMRVSANSTHRKNVDKSSGLALNTGEEE